MSKDNERFGKDSQISYQKIVRVLQGYKHWLWRDRTSIAELRTKVANLESDQADIRALINRLLARSDS